MSRQGPLAWADPAFLQGLLNLSLLGASTQPVPPSSCFCRCLAHCMLKIQRFLDHFLKFFSKFELYLISKGLSFTYSLYGVSSVSFMFRASLMGFQFF